MSAAVARLQASQEIGPLGCYVALHALRSSQQDSGAAFGDLGLKRLATRDVRRDYEMLLDPGSVLTRCLGNLASELGTLTPPEVEAIAESLPPNSAAIVRELARASRKAKDLPVVEVIGPILDRWWETTARRALESDFRFHARTSARPAAGQDIHTPTR